MSIPERWSRRVSSRHNICRVICDMIRLYDCMNCFYITLNLLKEPYLTPCNGCTHVKVFEKPYVLTLESFNVLLDEAKIDPQSPSIPR